MGKDREPQSMGDIEQQIQYQRRSQTWDCGIGIVSLFTGNFLLGNMEPGISRAILLITSSLVATGGLGMGFVYRSERINYLRGLRNGILQEAQQTATLANRPASQ